MLVGASTTLIVGISGEGNVPVYVIILTHKKTLLVTISSVKVVP